MSVRIFSCMGKIAKAAVFVCFCGYSFGGDEQKYYISEQTSIKVFEGGTEVEDTYFSRANSVWGFPGQSILTRTIFRSNGAEVYRQSFFGLLSAGRQLSYVYETSNGRREIFIPSHGGTDIRFILGHSNEIERIEFWEDSHPHAVFLDAFFINDSNFVELISPEEYGAERSREPTTRLASEFDDRFWMRLPSGFRKNIVGFASKNPFVFTGFALLGWLAFMWSWFIKKNVID